MDCNADLFPPTGTDRAEGPNGAINRRRFVVFGGVAIASSAVIAACRGATPPVSVAPPTTSTTALVGSPHDIALLNTAISLEAVAQAVYTQVQAGTLVTTSTTADLLKLFQAQHGQHQDELTRTVQAAGDKPFTQANPVIMAQVVQPRLAALTSEADVVNLAYDLEHMLAATCQAGVGTFDHATLDTLIIQIGAIEARHLALWAIISGKSATGTPDGAFETDQDAVSAGTGL